MNPLIQFKTKTLPFFIPLVLTCFALLPRAQAVVPAPDGGYPNGNTAEGNGALFSLTTGTYNTAVGLSALYSDTGGNRNTAVGLNVLRLNTSGNGNTAVGADALRFNVASGNTAIGDSALFHNTTGVDNAATGWRALFNNTTGYQNTATGSRALLHNTTGFHNTANGLQALFSNTTGVHNTANGFDALSSNIDGGDNTATGWRALFNNTTGSFNTANGLFALSSNTTGNDNTANGFEALFSNTTGRDNIALGSLAGGNLTTGSNNIDIGNFGVAAESNAIRIGRPLVQTALTYIAGISGTTVPNGVAVVVGTDGHLGTISSSRRFKDEIKPMDKASEAILALKPVAFRYKKEIDPAGKSQFGLVAEEVEKVNPDLVVRDKEGKPYTVRYDQVNAMLLNEFLKEHRKVEKLEAAVADLATTVKEQAAHLQRVSAQLDNSVPRVAMANQ